MDAIKGPWLRFALRGWVWPVEGKLPATLHSSLDVRSQGGCYPTGNRVGRARGRKLCV